MRENYDSMLIYDLRQSTSYLHDRDYSLYKNLSAYGSNAPPPFLPPPPAPSARYVQDLEQRNAELAGEVEALKRELSRDKERIQILESQLFKQSNPMPVPNAQSWDSKYSWAS